MAIDDPVAFAPPPAFGPFRVLHQIGIGALGPVFRTYEPTRDRLVAVKAFRLDITPEQSHALADELAKASDAGLFHPSIVEPIAAGVEGTVAYRAEEYVAAESLDAAIRHHAPARPDRALQFVTQLAGAIDFARASGIGHGALHLRDIFVTPEEARASGFGVVEALERTGVRAPVRRPYSAPERIAGEAWSTPADVFSLAAITYELLTGRRPSGTGEQIAPLTGEHLIEFGPGMRAVLARAMDDDPERRYATALGFASALEVAARGGRVSDVLISVPASPADRSNVDEAAAPPRRRTAGARASAKRGLPAGAAESADAGAPASTEPAGRAGSAASAGVVAAGAGAAESAVDARADADADLDELHPDDAGTTGGGAAEVPLRPADAGHQTGAGDIEDLADIDDIAAERDEDAAHFDLTHMHHDDDRDRTLFDDEGLDDLAAHAPLGQGGEARRFAIERDDEAAAPLQDAHLLRREERFADVEPDGGGDALDRGFHHEVDDAGAGAARADVPRRIGVDRAQEAPPVTEIERPRPAVLPIAVTLILGLLVGFAAGYWTGGRERNGAISPPGAAAPGAQGAAPAGAGPDGATSGSSGAPPGAPAGNGKGVTGSAAAVEPPRTPPAVPDEVPEPAEGAGAAARTAPAAPSRTVPAAPTRSGPAAPPRTTAGAAARTAPAAPPAAAAPAGRLVITSTPPRANVTVDGRWRGRTPLTIERLALGPHGLRVVAPGFAVTKEDVTLTASAPSRTVALRLQRAPGGAQANAGRPGAAGAAGRAPGGAAKPVERGGAPAASFLGSIYVDSRPRGARILIDGRASGTTPARIPEVSIGSHVVRLELADHRAWTVSTRVAAGEETRVTGSLERIP